MYKNIVAVAKINDGGTKSGVEIYETVMHGTQLATLENEERSQGFKDILDLYFAPNTECEWSG